MNGMGGIGKTQFALHYIRNPPYPYQLRAWFPSESKTVLLEAYHSFGKAMGLSIATVHEAVATVKQWLETQQYYLLVYDNVESYESIADYLPDGGNGHILLTSRDQYLPDSFVRIRIDVMSSDDSIAFMKQLSIRRDGVENKHDDNDSNIAELAKELGYLPLAMAQASAYIQQTPGHTFAEYLELFRRNAQVLLSKGRLPTGTLHHVSVAATWQTSIDAIEREERSQNRSPMVRSLLFACAYLSPEPIPEDILKQWICAKKTDSDSEDMFNSCKQLLLRYSMITTGGRVPSLVVHRLVQKVLRHEHLKALTKPLLIQLMNAVNKNFYFDSNPSEGEARRAKRLPHLLSLIANYDRALEEHKLEDEVVAVSLHNAAFVYNDIGDSKKAKELLERALIIKGRHYGTDHTQVAVTLGNLGIVYNALGDSMKAKEMLECALVIEERHYGANHAEVASTLGNLGNVYRSLGDSVKTKEMYERALVIKEHHYSTDHTQVAVTLGNLGIVYNALGDSMKAKEMLECALVIEERHYGANHAEVASTLGNLGNVYRSLGDSVKTKEMYERALVIKEHHYSTDHTQVAVTLGNLGNVYDALGDSVKAKELLERALVIMERHYGPHHAQVAITLGNLGNVYETLGDSVKAKELYERALVIEERHYGLDHAQVGITLGNLGNVYRSLGDSVKTKEMYERASICVRPWVHSVASAQPVVISALASNSPANAGERH